MGSTRVPGQVLGKQGEVLGMASSPAQPEPKDCLKIKAWALEEGALGVLAWLYGGVLGLLRGLTVGAL